TRTVMAAGSPRSTRVTWAGSTSIRQGPAAGMAVPAGAVDEPNSNTVVAVAGPLVPALLLGRPWASESKYHTWIVAVKLAPGGIGPSRTTRVTGTVICCRSATSLPGR